MNPLDLVTPDLGLMFWTIVVFICLLLILKKFAWKPILESVEQRTLSIEKALTASEDAKAEIANLTAKQDAIHKQSLADRDALLNEAEDTKNNSKMNLKNTNKFITLEHTPKTKFIILTLKIPKIPNNF